MTAKQTYQKTDKMSDLIADNHKMLMVLSRFGIKLGFGDSTVGEICEQQHVNTSTFLAVANFINQGCPTDSLSESTNIELSSLMLYLENAHTYFLDFNLPTIRRKLIEALDFSSANDVALLILRFFDEYAGEIRRHMEYENKDLFTYVTELLKGIKPVKSGFNGFDTKHNRIDAKLKELMNIIIKYYPEEGNNNLMNSVLIDIFDCEQDIMTHSLVEDRLLMPLAKELERTL